MSLTEEVRRNAAAMARDARAVRIDEDALATAYPDLVEVGPPPLDAEAHYLDGSEADVATFFLTLDAINFGSGWFPTLHKRPGKSGYMTIATALADRFRAGAPWTNAELRALRTEEIADVLGQPRDHELMTLFAQALRELGRFLGERGAFDVIAEAGGSAERLAQELAAGMALFADRGFYKRAQIVPNDLALAGVAQFSDLDRLTIFADNLIPHVLRCDGVLVYDDLLAARIDADELLPVGPWEREIRACAVHACELLAQRLSTPARVLDTWLWNRGQEARYKKRPRHRTRTVYY